MCQSYTKVARIVAIWNCGRKTVQELHLINGSCRVNKRDSLFTSWQNHIGLLQTVTKDKFCSLFIHTTDTSVTLTHVTAVK